MESRRKNSKSGKSDKKNLGKNKKKEAEEKKTAREAKAAFVAEERAKRALKSEEKVATTEAQRNRKNANLAAEAAGEAASSSTRKHGVGLIENKSPSFWKSQSITILKQQAELRGHRFSDLETKGGGTKSKFKKFKKADYLETLLNLLKKYLFD